MGKTLLTHVRIDVETSEIKSETFVRDGRDEALQKGEELIRRIFTYDFGYDSEDEFIDESVDDFKAHGTFDDEADVRHLLFVKDESDD